MDSEKKLRALGGKLAPKEFLDDVDLFSKLPKSAKESIWEILQKNINPTQDDSGEYLDSYISQHGISDPRLFIKVINSLSYLIKNAFANDLSLSWFAGDLENIGFKNSDRAALAAEYDQEKTKYRNTATIQTLGDHGLAYLGASWRINSVQSSNRGLHLNFQTVDISFRYHDHGAEKKKTFSFTPQNINEMKMVLDEIIVQFSTDVIKIKNNS